MFILLCDMPWSKTESYKPVTVGIKSFSERERVTYDKVLNVRHSNKNCAILICLLAPMKV